MQPYRRLQVAVGCRDPVGLSQFYVDLLGYAREAAPAGFATLEGWLEARGVPRGEWDDGRAIVDPEGAGPRIWFHALEHAGVAPGRIHLDFYLGLGPRAPIAKRKARVDPEVERAVRLGARVVERVEDGDYYFVTCEDPEGNLFDIA